MAKVSRKPKTLISSSQSNDIALPSKELNVLTTPSLTKDYATYSKELATLTTQEKIRNLANKINELYSSLYNYSYYLTKNRYDAEDLLSDSILKALKNHESYSEENSLKSYMNSIIHNTFINSFHRKNRELNYLSKAQIEYSRLPLPGSDSERELIPLYLSELDNTSQKIVYLIDVLHYTYAEVSQLLDIPVGTIMSRLSRARKKLRLELINSN